MKSRLFDKSYMLIFLFLVSCGGADYNATFSTEEGVVALKDKIEETFDTDKAISNLSISMQNFDSDSVEQISIFFPENNKNTLWFYSYATGQLHKPEAKEASKNTQKTKKISAFSLDECYPNFKKAIALIENETDEFSNYHIYSYDMKVDQTSDKIDYNFTLLANKNEISKPTFYGKKIYDHLYRFEFGTNAEGNLIATQGLDAFEE